MREPYGTVASTGTQRKTLKLQLCKNCDRLPPDYRVITVQIVGSLMQPVSLQPLLQLRPFFFLLLPCWSVFNAGSRFAEGQAGQLYHTSHRVKTCNPESLFRKLILHLLFLLPQPVCLFPLLFLFLVFPAHIRSWIANTEAP